MVTYAEPVWWKDTYGHEWKNTIKNHYHDRISGTDCPYCSYKKLMVGFNDLLSQYPDLARSWSMRNGMDARHIMPLMTREYWWTCKQGHDYKASINDLMRGRDCPYCSDRKLMQGFNDFASKAPDWVMEQWDHQRNDPLGLYPDHVLWSADVHAWWKCEHGHQWSTSVYHRSGSTSRISGCPYCSASKGYSHAEKKLLDAVAAMVDDKVIANDKQVLGGKKIDVYVPARGVGIEYNGLYWHSELYLDNAYHYDKWRQANNAGIRLIQVWEDEWSTKPDVVLDCIRSAMGIRMMYKDDARKLYVHNVSNAEAKPFFNDNHIQGWVSGNRILGLYQGESLIACCAFRKYQNMESTIEITRYATLLGHTVRGGMSRLLKHAMADAHADHVITFSDHCVSNGDSYRKLGFINDGEIRPDYAYINNNSREHKFNYRLQDFKNNPDFEYHDGMTEHELATLNGLYRVYDAGKTKWRYDH
jgi:DNA-directed RNA polymerase subunit RPC12/RpoP